MIDFVDSTGRTNGNTHVMNVLNRILLVITECLKKQLVSKSFNDSVLTKEIAFSFNKRSKIPNNNNVNH